MTLGKILIIDDDAPTCDLLKTIFDMQDYETEAESDVENDDIIQLLNNKEPDLLILDCHLRDEETLHYVKTIRRDQAWQDLAVLMMSAIDRESECLKVGADSFVLKPFDWKDISAAVETLKSKTA